MDPASRAPHLEFKILSLASQNGTGTSLLQPTTTQNKLKLVLRIIPCSHDFSQKLHAAVRSTFSSENAKKTDILRPLFEVQMFKNCTPLWREAHFQVKTLKNWRSRTTFWSSDVEKLHAAVARSTFSSENAQKTDILRPLFEVQMLKNCTPLWREAHFQVKILNNWRSRTTFWSSDVEKLHAAVARSTFPSQNVQNTCVSPRFLKFRCRKISQLVN